MDLKEARAIARRVGATIEERSSTEPGDLPAEYIVRLGICRIGSNGTREEIKLHYPTADLAAHGAIIETAKACNALAAAAKETYVSTDLIYLASSLTGNTSGSLKATSPSPSEQAEISVISATREGHRPRKE